MSRSPGAREVLRPGSPWTLAALAGLLLAAAFPPVAAAPLVFVALVPLLVALDSCPRGPVGRWEATRLGLLAGAVYFGLTLSWLLTALLRFSLLAIPAYLGAVAVLAGLVGAFGAAVHLTRDRLGWPLAIRVVVFWTALEWVQAHLGPLAFPWLGLGTALAPIPALAGAAELVGARGLTAWIAGVNGLLATALVRLRAARPVMAPAAGALALLIPPALFGWIRAATLELEPVARVAVVQPNIAQEVKLDPRLALDSSLAALTTLTGRLEPGQADLVTWPEVALPITLERERQLVGRVAAMSRRVEAPILVGAYGTDAPEGAGDRFNSAFLVDAEGVRGPRYDKRRLVPFVERTPFLRTPAADTAAGRFGSLAPGREAPRAALEDGRRFGVLICYESAFAPLGRSYRRPGDGQPGAGGPADWLVNITNDAWFGGEAPGSRTAALRQHPSHLPLRAIETRTGVVRAANTGISMFVDPIGRSYGHAPPFQPALLVETVYRADVRTLYTRWGDWLGTLLAVTALLALAWAHARHHWPGR